MLRWMITPGGAKSTHANTLLRNDGDAIREFKDKKLGQARSDEL
jgi:hypothetical protein